MTGHACTAIDGAADAHYSPKIIIDEVDTVMGGHVFDRLFQLPLVFYQERPTGVITARPHGIETVCRS